MLFKRFDVSPEYVQIDEDIFVRPQYIGASQWVEFWEDAKAENNYDAGYEEGREESKREIQDLEDEKEALEDEITDLEDEIADLQKEVNNLEDELNDTLSRFDKEYDRGFQDGLGADDS